MQQEQQRAESLSRGVGKQPEPCPSQPTLSLPSPGQVGEATAPAHAHVQL